MVGASSGKRPAHITQLKAYFEEHPAQLQMTNSRRELPLHCAVWQQQGQHALTIVATLLQAYTPTGLSSESAAACRCDKASWATQRMRDQGAACNVPCNGRLPLQCAAMFQLAFYAVAWLRRCTRSSIKPWRHRYSVCCVLLHVLSLCFRHRSGETDTEQDEQDIRNEDKRDEGG